MSVVGFVWYTQQWLYLFLNSSVWCFTQVKPLGGSCFVLQRCSSYRSVLRRGIQWAWKCIDGLWTRRWNYSGKASTKILSLIFPTICQHVHLIIYLFVFLLPPSNPYVLSSHLTILFLHSVYKSAPAFYRPSLLGFLSNQKCRGLIAEGFVSLTYGANKATGSFLHNGMLSTCSCYLLFQTWLFKGSSCGPTVFICTSELGLQFAGN